MAPVMSSVTVACCVRSPSATVCSSFISRRIAAWLASLTRLASCSWRSASSALRLGQPRRAGPGRARTGAGSRSRRADQRPAPSSSSDRACTPLKPVSLPSRSCTVLEALAQRLAVGHDRRLRFARGHQALQVAEDRAGLRARLLVLLEQRGQALARLRVLACPAGAAPGCRRAGPWRSRGTSSGPCRAGTRPRGSRLRSSGTRWPTCRCAASASPAGRPPTARPAWRPAAASATSTVSAVSSRSDDWRLIARSAWPTCVSVFCCAMHDVGVLLGAVDQRQQRLERVLHAGRRGGDVARRRSSGRARCCASTSALSRTSGNAAGAADQRLRHRLGQPLRLHQRLAGGADLRRAAARRRRATAIVSRSGRPGRARARRAGCAAARATGRWPISGRPVPSGAAPASASCRRVSVNSAHLATARPRR